MSHWIDRRSGRGDIHTDNFFGVDSSGNLLRVRVVDVDVFGFGSVRMGPGNLFGPTDGWNVFVSGPLAAQAVVRATHNRFPTKNLSSAIYYSLGSERASEPTRPSVVAAQARQVTGSCPRVGNIELFDTSGEFTEFLGQTPCQSDVIWSLSALALTSGTSVAATLTDTSGRTSPFSRPLVVP